jgi:hypothetical protein
MTHIWANESKDKNTAHTENKVTTAIVFHRASNEKLLMKRIPDEIRYPYRGIKLAVTLFRAGGLSQLSTTYLIFADGAHFIRISAWARSSTPAGRSGSHAYENNHAISSSVGTCVFGGARISISRSRSEESVQVWPRESLAKNSSWLLIRLRRIVGFEFTAGANLNSSRRKCFA